MSPLMLFYILFSLFMIFLSNYAGFRNGFIHGVTHMKDREKRLERENQMLRQQFAALDELELKRRKDTWDAS